MAPRATRSNTPPSGPLDCLDAVYLAEARPGQELPTQSDPEVAFAGRSNVGKSTLLNRLCQRRSLARTSKTPGCTRGIVLFRLTLRGGARFVIADLPGYGFAERSKTEREGWASMIEHFLQRRASLAGVVILIDARRGVSPDEETLITYLKHINRAFFVVLTKADKLARNERARVLREVHDRVGAPVIATSGETGDGREEVLRRLSAMVHRGTDEAQPDTLRS